MKHKNVADNYATQYVECIKSNLDYYIREEAWLNAKIAEIKNKRKQDKVLLREAIALEKNYIEINRLLARKRARLTYIIDRPHLWDEQEIRDEATYLRAETKRLAQELYELPRTRPVKIDPNSQVDPKDYQKETYNKEKPT